jgi:hypothetical protein
MVWRAGGRAELQVAMLLSRKSCQQQSLASKAVDMNARDTDTFRLVQTVIGSSSSSSSRDSMQEDKEEEAAPHALEERHTGPWTKTMLVDRLRRRCDETDQRRPMRTNSFYLRSFGTSVPISPDHISRSTPSPDLHICIVTGGSSRAQDDHAHARELDARARSMLPRRAPAPQPASTAKTGCSAW